MPQGLRVCQGTIYRNAVATIKRNGGLSGRRHSVTWQPPSWMSDEDRADLNTCIEEFRGVIGDLRKLADVSTGEQDFHGWSWKVHALTGEARDMRRRLAQPIGRLAVTKSEDSEALNPS